MRVALLVLFLLAAGAAGCSAYRSPPRETPETPLFDDVNAAREGQAASVAPDLSVRMGSSLRSYGLQPHTRSDRRHAMGRDTIAAAWLAGKDPVRAGSLIIVAVSPASGAAALGGFAELARVTARLARHSLMPEPTLLFATLPAGREAAVLEALARAPTWVADSVQAVVVMGGVQARGVVTIPALPTAGATARAAYERLRGMAYGHRTPADTSKVVTYK